MRPRRICDILILCAGYKCSYLLTYLLKWYNLATSRCESTIYILLVLTLPFILLVLTLPFITAML